MNPIVTITSRNIQGLIEIDDWLVTNTISRVEVFKDHAGSRELVASYNGDRRKKTMGQVFEEGSRRSKSLALYGHDTSTEFAFGDAREATLFKLTWA